MPSSFTSDVSQVLLIQLSFFTPLLNELKFLPQKDIAKAIVSIFTQFFFWALKKQKQKTKKQVVLQWNGLIVIKRRLL